MVRRTLLGRDNDLVYKEQRIAPGYCAWLKGSWSFVHIIQIRLILWVRIIALSNISQTNLSGHFSEYFKESVFLRCSFSLGVGQIPFQ